MHVMITISGNALKQTREKYRKFKQINHCLQVWIFPERFCERLAQTIYPQLDLQLPLGKSNPTLLATKLFHGKKQIPNWKDRRKRSLHIFSRN